jgi:hypothetical protein
MPCRDDGPVGPSYREIHYPALAAFACAQFTAGVAVPSELKTWWTDHRVRDQERILDQAWAANREAARRAALDKLSPEERTLLGLP